MPRVMPIYQNPVNTVLKLNPPESPKKEVILNNDDDQRRKPSFLFSIDYILNKAGEKNTKNNIDDRNTQKYEWLNCTRFKPPKLDRTKKKDGLQRQKRRPGRNPRIPFTIQQVKILEHEFQRSAYLGGNNDVHILSERLRLSENRIKIWFQNRRARERRDKLNGFFLRPSCITSIAEQQQQQQQQLITSSTSAFKPLFTSQCCIKEKEIDISSIS